MCKTMVVSWTLGSLQHLPFLYSKLDGSPRWLASTGTIVSHLVGGLLGPGVLAQLLHLATCSSRAQADEGDRTNGRGLAPKSSRESRKGK